MAVTIAPTASSGIAAGIVTSRIIAGIIFLRNFHVGIFQARAFLSGTGDIIGNVSVRPAG
jgi:hypothetical protein